MSIKLADLFEEIERRGLSVAQFARQAGIPEDRVYQWKAGRGGTNQPAAILKSLDNQRLFYPCTGKGRGLVHFLLHFYFFY